MTKYTYMLKVFNISTNDYFNSVSVFLIAYQPSWVIQCESYSYRKTAAVIFNPKLGGSGGLYLSLEF